MTDATTPRKPPPVPLSRQNSPLRGSPARRSASNPSSEAQNLSALKPPPIRIKNSGSNTSLSEAGNGNNASKGSSKIRSPSTTGGDEVKNTTTSGKSKPFKGSSDPAFYIDVGLVGLVLLVFGPLISSCLFPGWTGTIIYIIAASCYLSMKFADRETKQQRLANVIIGNHHLLKEVVDAKVMQHVLSYLPGYIRDCDMEQCRWANTAGAAIFPYAAAFEAHKMKIKLNDRLAQMKGIAEVSVQTLDAGSIAPFCSGIKVHPYMHDKRVVIDADIVWNGRPNVLINVRIGGQGFDIEVYEMTLNGRMRFIVGPLCVAATPAKALGISFRETPFIRFGMRIGGVDVMNLGSGPAQVCHIVDGMMKKVVNEVFLYPNVSWSALDKSYNIRELQTVVNPVGLLSVNVLSAKDLIIADVSTSDPYIKLALGTEERSTKIINRNLNPVWNEHHVLTVYNQDIQVLELNVFDSDTFGSDDPLGRATIKLVDLEYYKREELDIRLEGVPHGTVQLDVMFIPLECGNPDNSEMNSPMISDRMKTMSGDDMDLLTEEDDAMTETASQTGSTARTPRYMETTPRNQDMNSGTTKKEKGHRSSFGLKKKIRAVGRFMIRNKSDRIFTLPHSSAFGVIVFDMISCKELPAKDLDCEAFVQFKFNDHAHEAEEAAGHGSQVRRMTEIAHGTNSPNFSRTVTFIVPNEFMDQSIKVKVKDNAQKAKVLGEALLSIREVCQSGLLHKTLMISPQLEQTVVEFRAMWCQPTLQPRVFPPKRPDLGTLPEVNW